MQTHHTYIHAYIYMRTANSCRLCTGALVACTLRVCQRVRWHLCTALWCVASESSDHPLHTFIVPPFHPPCPPPQSSLVRTYTPIVTQYPPSDAAGTTQWQQTRWAHVAEYMLLNKHNAMATASSIHMVRHARCCSALSSSLSHTHTHIHR